MRVLVVTQYFWPESFRINQVVKSLTRCGCQVTVLTGQPNYPDGVVFDGFYAAAMKRERHEDGYQICRVPLFPRGSASVTRLMGNYVSFVVAASVFGPWLLRGAEFDVVFVYAPSPILQVIPAVLIKSLKRAPLVTWVQDLWPQSLESTGFVRNRGFLHMVERLVSWLYRRNDLLLAQSRSFVPSIQELSGLTPVKYFPNPGESGAGDPSPSSHPRSPLVLDPGFNVVFAGNLGTVQALDTILDAAELLRSTPDIRFILVGSGSRSGWLQTEVQRRGLDNVRLMGRFPVSEMPGIMAQASALLVTLIRSPTMSRTIPSKVQAYLAAGRPIIAALDGEGAEVVREAGAGISVPAEDAEALAGAIRELHALDDRARARLGEAGRSFYSKHFDPDVLAQELIGHFRRIASPPGAAARQKASA